MKRTIFFLLLTVFIVGCTTTQKVEQVQQTTKSAIVKADSVYEDKFEIPFDDKGVQFTVHISFYEETNQMLLSLIGTRKLFVFRKDTKYKDVFKHPLFASRKLRPERLKYSVLVQPRTTYRLPKVTYHDFIKPRKKHLFNQWLENLSDNIKPIEPSPTSLNSVETALVYDSLVQRFDVDPDAKQLSFTLRNILIADLKDDGVPVEQLQKFKKKHQRYNLVCDKDLKLTYNVTLQRNPCFGSSETLDSVNNRIQKIIAAYKALKDACPTGTVLTKQELGIFQQHRDYMLSRYPKAEETHDCPAVQDALNKYNNYVDSIKQVPCVYVPETSTDTPTGTISLGCRPDVLLAAAHTLDNTVAKILASKDAMEIRDLRASGREVMRTINNSILERGIINDEQHKALAAYRRAEAYFKNLIKY